MHTSRTFHKKRSVKAGLPPGSLVHIGTPPTTAAGIDIMLYDHSICQEQHCLTMESCLPLLGQPGITWLNVEGVHDVELIRTLGEHYSLHPLVLEDIVSTVQRPKVEDYGDYTFIVMRMLRPLPGGDFDSEQLSMVLGSGFLLTFQEGLEGDQFDPVRTRIRTGKGKVRSMGADYLCYSLIDAIVDSYFTVLEGFGERVLDIEEELASSPTRRTLVQINSLKKEIIYLRKAIWPMRELLGFLERGDSELVQDSSRVYFRDVYDHTIQAMDSVETYRDLLMGMLDLYLSSISNRTNEIMKFLTVIGTIFMPLTFLVGVYGMNFKHMPELEWYNGYFMLWGIMISLTLGMVIYFRRKRWL
jgi:magnesium transporter